MTPHPPCPEGCCARVAAARAKAAAKKRRQHARNPDKVREGWRNRYRRKVEKAMGGPSGPLEAPIPVEGHPEAPGADPAP